METPFSLITDPKNALLNAGCDLSILADSGHISASASLTSRPFLSFGNASSVNGMVLVVGSNSLMLRKVSLVKVEVRAENIWELKEVNGFIFYLQ